jgi:hypothetical protein
MYFTGYPNQNNFARLMLYIAGLYKNWNQTKKLLNYVNKRNQMTAVLGYIKIDMKQEEFENTKGTIRIRLSKKNRQHNGQKKKYKRTNNDLQNIHIKQKIE